jgi:hypothetical protein
METTILMIDTTTPRDAAAYRNLLMHLQGILARPGERLLIATFAGLASGQHPRTVLDVYQEPVPDSAFVEGHVIETTDLLRHCLDKLWPVNLARVRKVLSDNTSSNPKGKYSEIAFAFRWSIDDVLAQVPGTRKRVIMFSDGLLNSRTGQSFYLHGLPRTIRVEQELAILERSGLGAQPNRGAQPFDVVWIGLGIAGSEALAYESPADFDAKRSFWMEVAKRYGAQSVHVGLTVQPDVLH